MKKERLNDFKSQVIKVKYTLPGFNFSIIINIVALLSSWALHESMFRSLIAFIFGWIYLIGWVVFGDSATKEGLEYISEYYDI